MCPHYALLAIRDRYSIWIRKEKEHLEDLTSFLINKEYELRRHPEFDDVHEDDLKALADFKKSLGIKQVVDTSFQSTDDRSISVAATPSPSALAGSSRRLSALSKGSKRSRLSGMSAQSELSPLLEEDNDDESNSGDEGSPTPQKRRRLHTQRASQNSVTSSITKSTINRGGTIPEENESDESVSGNDSEE